MFLEVSEKLLGIGAVDDAMIETRSEVSHVADRDVVFAIWSRKNFRALFDSADAEDRYLRLIDNRRAEQTAKHTGIRDRKRAAGDFVRLELFGARSIGEIVGRASQA